MKMLVKNKIFSIIVLTMLVLPVSLQAIPSVETLDTIQEEVIQPETTQEVPKVFPATDGDMNSFPKKQPVSKKKIAKKFLFAMGGVGISSIIIFLMLTLYNRIRDGFVSGMKTPEGEVSLETPNDLEDAVKVFLDKTKWN